MKLFVLIAFAGFAWVFSVTQLSGVSVINVCAMTYTAVAVALAPTVVEAAEAYVESERRWQLRLDKAEAREQEHRERGFE